MPAIPIISPRPKRRCARCTRMPATRSRSRSWQKPGSRRGPCPRWLMAMGEHDRWVDTTDVIDRKVKALLCHQSQIKDPDAMDKLLRGWGAATAASVGLGEGRSADGFRHIATA